MSSENIQATLDERGIQPATIVGGSRMKPSNPSHPTEVATGGIPSVFGSGLGELSTVANLNQPIESKKIDPKFPNPKPLPKLDNQRRNSADRVIINQPK